MNKLRLRLTRSMLCVGLLSGTQPVLAEWVKATGQAEIVNGQYEQARREAREDALRQAALQAGAQISTESQMDQGQVTLDRVNVSSTATVQSVRLADERIDGNLLTLTLYADMVSKPVKNESCDIDNRFRKQVAMLGFAVQNPRQAALGGLEGTPRDLPGLLTRELNEQGHLNVLEASQYRLFDDVNNAPTRETDRNTLANASLVAKRLGVQFVVTGVIRNIGVRNEEAFQHSVWKDSLRFWGMSDAQRTFSVDVFVYDGFSGALVFQHHYETQGSWHTSGEEPVGFATPRFWQLDYGKAVRASLSNMVANLDEDLRCQPFITRITRVDGNMLQFNAGGTNGIRPGDELSVYRSSEYYDAGSVQGTQLKDVEVDLRVTHVQPGFAQGELPKDAGQYNIQTDDVLIAW